MPLDEQNAHPGWFNRLAGTILSGFSTTLRAQVMRNSAMRFFAFIILAAIVLATGFGAIGASAGMLPGAF
jgi:hypothetical protein